MAEFIDFTCWVCKQQHPEDEDCPSLPSSVQSSGYADKDEVIQRLREQLQNCVNHLEMAKRQTRCSDETKINACIEYANRVLYETLSA